MTDLDVVAICAGVAVIVAIHDLVLVPWWKRRMGGTHGGKPAE
jgi:hypothetical protein